MIITTNQLNNIETKLSTITPLGIFIVNFNDNNNALSHNYNEIKAQFESGNLVLIKYYINNSTEESCDYRFIAGLEYIENKYKIYEKNGFEFNSDSATGTLTIQN